MHEYIDALIYAAEEGYKTLPRVTVEICAPCYGIKLSAKYEGFTIQEIVGWDNFKETRFPGMMLASKVQGIREKLCVATKPKLETTPGIAVRMDP